MALTWHRLVLLLTGLLIVSGGCKSTYYKTWEKLGWEKRDILSDRVKDARDSQNVAKEQFKTTLQRFQEVTKFEGGNLEAQYKKLNNEFQKANTRADTVRERIDSVESVAADMFKEWKAELKEYSNAELRRSSEQKLDDTRRRYDQFIAAMHRAEERMNPVLVVFKDQVLFLKHNLNAAAIDSLQTTTAGVEDDVSQLIAEMEASIAEANEFMKQIK